MADALHEAWLDLRRKEQIWHSAYATCDHVRSAGSESAVAVRAIADRMKADGTALSPQEIAIVQDFKDAIQAADLAADAEIAAREALAAAAREYKKLELAWSTAALSRFQARWLRARPSLEARCG